MSIQLHCPLCGKLIKAPDDAGGKRGKCPYCEGKVYIPSAPSDEEEIGIAPLDEEAERQAQELADEAAEYAASLSRETGSPRDGGGKIKDRPPSTSVTPGEVVDVPQLVEKFVTAMRDSKLEQADRCVSQLARAGQRARDYVEGVMLDEMAPSFEGVPPAVQKGFLKALLERLKA
jgi:DNA-directed RNA polymerase subunit RPC12/RpoP